ncbi:LOW QUALITY PROTEIN: hypothetical protein PanWU01x14_313280 [Parasponia andersonii]|uniref:Uncharacterized protein n=1 Tax=Parasponia andersonii TaxID=3476 RepID=A0A2P5AP95_PARAD|nr:LOW QUALITY PROTEIN: hypothetical protein PanWU01x14_313280 [Parasponia andersonii]
MLRTRGQFKRWPRRRLSRAKQSLEGTRIAAISKTLVKISSPNRSSSSSALGKVLEGVWDEGMAGMVPLRRVGP